MVMQFERKYTVGVVLLRISACANRIMYFDEVPMLTVLDAPPLPSSVPKSCDGMPVPVVDVTWLSSPFAVIENVLVDEKLMSYCQPAWPESVVMTRFRVWELPGIAKCTPRADPTARVAGDV
jgi:hypothetical protein